MPDPTRMAKIDLGCDREVNQSLFPKIGRAIDAGALLGSTALIFGESFLRADRDRNLVQWFYERKPF